MGKYNSSVYRVRPLMKLIEEDDGALVSLLSLFGIAPLGKPNKCLYDGGSSEKQEMKLKPTKRHLLALIDYLAEKNCGDLEVKGENRRMLFFGDEDERREACENAKAQLEAKYDTLTFADRPWYVFEGFSCPDIFIEGDDYVIVGEGKWTEPNITNRTTYLSGGGEYRNQMVRHVQGALNYTSKRVYAFYIVDGECGYTDQLTKESFLSELELESIKLCEDEKRRIADSYYGYTTWQDIQRILPKLAFKSKSEI